MPLEATERWSDRKLTIKTTNDPKKPPAWTAERAWDVVGTTQESLALRAPGVGNSPAVAQINDSHPENGRLKVDGQDVQRIGFDVWVVKCTYSVPPDDDKHKDSTDPLKEPAEIQWEFGNANEKFDCDIDGKPVVNSAGQPFQQPYSKNFGTIHLTISRNEPYFDVQKAIKFQNKINSDSWNVLGIGVLEPGQAQCLVIKPTRSYKQKAQYVNVAYQFELRAGKKKDDDGLWDGFKLRVLDQGRQAWYSPGTGSAALGIIQTSDGKTKSEDSLLDGKGQPKDTTVKVAGSSSFLPNPSQVTWATTEQTDVAVFLKFKQYAATSFSGLQLQTST